MDKVSHHPPAPKRTPMARRAIERCLEPLVFKRHLPGTAGGAPLIVSTRVGGLKYLFRTSSSWDPQLLRIAGLLAFQGSCVWDVGANVGLFSRAAAYHAGADGAIVSFEADIDAVSLLNRTCRHRLSGHADITVLPVAVGSSVGFARFDIAMRARAANALSGFGTTQTGGVQESRTLPCITLDSALAQFRAPDVLKIDVEGAELEVLRGAPKIIADMRPAIYCEVQRDTIAEASALLAGHGYRLWDGDHFSGSVDDPPASAATCNLLALPREKVGRILQHHD